MAWFLRNKKNIEEQTQRNMPDGLWTKDPINGSIIYKTELEENLFISPETGYHFRIGSKEYINIILDDKSFVEYDSNLEASDPLEFTDTKDYPTRIIEAKKKSGLNEAMTCGIGKIKGEEVSFACMNFNFVGGSMGAVVGEKIYRSVQRAIKNKIPFILISASGGARMQEAAISLMQMAKSAAALAELGENKLPFFSLLTDPTTGGVTASYAMLGDLNIAEPNALIGFAGPRVIEQTIKKKLPAGFQRAEFVLEKGFLDTIIKRNELKDELYKLIQWFKN